MTCPFVHLHVHSHFSLLDGCTSPAGLAQAAAELGMPALALTDHDALYGAVEFYDACRAAGVQPIIGLELRLDAGDPLPDSLVLLARDTEGYANLCRLSSALQTRTGPESPPNGGLPLSELEGRTAGLIALNGGKQGRIERLIRAGRIHDAESAALAWAERFSHDSFYLELQIQEPGDAEIASTVAGLAHKLRLGTVATNNVHYLVPHEAEQCRLVSAMRHLRPLDQVDSRDGLHLASAAEMARAFVDFPEAQANTAAIAQACHLDLPLGRPVFPEIDLPAGQTAGDLLRAQVLEGAGRRYEDLTGPVRTRMDTELITITSMGYAPLFLIVGDVVRYARDQGIPVNLRGSAAGSLVAYCLGISAVDPIALDLYFERFLNPERRDPPDIDLDLCSRRREEVIRYIYRRFGQDRVATICTYARLRARSAWREVAKAYRFPKARIDAIAKKIPRFFHPGMSGEVEDAKGELLAAAQNDLERRALGAAWGLDGHPRHLSVHPGGIVIAPGPLTDSVPLQLASKGVIITQYDLHSIERLGLVKIDLLGIRALTVVAESVEMVLKAGTPLEPEGIPDGDPATGDLLARADTIGCFQTESPGMRRTLRELGTRTLEDVTVTLALYKPGPLRGGLKDAFVRRHRGQEPTRYLHPSLEPILRSTYGVVIYQEQVLRIANELAGFSLGEADTLRRGIAHLGHGDELLPVRDDFIARVGQVSGLSTSVATRLWEQMASFAGYGFLKAHAASYAAVAYRTATLKVHHPAEFMTAVLRNWGGYYPQRAYLGEARRMGLQLRPPHINHSGRRFEIEYGPDGRPVLWMGLGQVRDLTRKTTTTILSAREQRPFDSLDDLLRRARPRLGEVENLVKAGALDGLGTSRRALLAQLEGRSSSAPLQATLPFFQTSEETEPSDSLLEKLSWEQEMLGWPVSEHPLKAFAAELKTLGAVRSDALVGRAAGEAIVAGARLGLWGERRGTFTLEDEAGLITVRVTPGKLPRPGVLGKLGPYWVRGRLQLDRTGEVSVRADRIEPL